MVCQCLISAELYRQATHSFQIQIRKTGHTLLKFKNYLLKKWKEEVTLSMAGVLMLGFSTPRLENYDKVFSKKQES